MQTVLRKYFSTFLLGAVILTYLALRVAIAPISDDEYLTYREHVHKDLCTILTNASPDVYWAPNNHILNTLLVKLSIGVFGDHDWALRLHILVAFVACFYFVARLLARFAESPFRMTAYLGILFLNPYLLDFFSIARGYALSMAAWSAAMFYFGLYYEKASLRHLRNTLVSLFLAVWANYSALYFLPLFGLMFLYRFYQNRREGYSKTQLLLAATGLLAIAGAVVVPLGKALAAGTLTWGTGSFFQDTFVASVDYYMHYNVHLGRFDRFSGAWSKAEAYAVALIVGWSLLQLFTLLLPAGKKGERLYYAMLFQCLGLVVVVLLLHALLGTAYPYHRTALLYSFPFLLCLFFSLENFIARFKKAALAVYLMFLFCVWHSAHSWNLENTMEWYQNGDAKRVFAYLEKEGAKEGRAGKLVLGAESWQYFSMAYYAETTYKDMVDLKFTDLSKEEKYDYLFVPQHSKGQVWEGYVPVVEFKHGILFKYGAK